MGFKQVWVFTRNKHNEPWFPTTHQNFIKFIKTIYQNLSKIYQIYQLCPYSFVNNLHIILFTNAWLPYPSFYIYPWLRYHDTAIVLSLISFKKNLYGNRKTSDSENVLNNLKNADNIWSVETWIAFSNKN